MGKPSGISATAAGGTPRRFLARREGRIVCLAVAADDVLKAVRTTRVVLAAAHRNHDTSDNANANLAAFCQRCHMTTTGPSISGVGGGPYIGGRRRAICSVGPTLKCAGRSRPVEDTATGARRQERRPTLNHRAESPTT